MSALPALRLSVVNRRRRRVPESTHPSTTAQWLLAMISKTALALMASSFMIRSGS